jgi:GNAT superfamily N-acetyltransferase
MEAIRLSGGTTEDREHAYATLLSAFRADPVERWLYPVDHEYEQSFPAFLEAFGGEAFARETVWRLGPFAALAMWLPPGAEPDTEQIVQVLTTTVATARLSDTMAALEQMAAAHPRYPHWYLPWFGVTASSQGSGLGGALMVDCLRVVDETGLPAYLETPNPRTVSFYERYGFQVTGSTHTRDCPVITFMLRAGEH